MPRSYWDWGVNPTGVRLAPQIGPAELAARLGSIVTYDRLGEVIFLEGFEDGKNRWIETFTISNGNVELSTARARSGAYSVLLTGPTSGNLRTTIHITRPVLEPTRIGFEYSFSVASALPYMEWLFNYQDPTTLTEFRIRWDNDADELLYFDENGALVAFASLELFDVSAALWMTGKLIVDTSTKKYVRFAFNETIHSLADIPARQTVTAVAPRNEFHVRLYSDSGDNDTAYIDDVILTQNEP